MKRSGKALLSVLLTAVMVCGMLTPAFAVWPTVLESNLYSMDGYVWVDMHACSFTPYTDDGTGTTVYSPNGVVWFTAAGAQQYYGSTVPPDWMSGTPDSSYVSPDGGMLWLRDFPMAYMDWESYWNYQLNQPMPQNVAKPSMLFRLPDSAVYWVEPVSWSVLYEPVFLSTAAVTSLGIRASSYMDTNNVGDNDRLLFALVDPLQNGIQNTPVWTSDLMVAGGENHVGYGDLFDALYAQLMRNWLAAVNVPISFDPNTRQACYGYFESNPNGTTVLNTFPSPATPTGSYFQPQFLYIKAPCDCTVSFNVNFHAAPNIYCMLDLGDLLGYGWGNSNEPQTQIIINEGQQGYYPIGNYGTFTDTDGNGIIDPYETSIPLGSYVMPDNTYTNNPFPISIHMNAGRTYRIPVYIWNEAQSLSSFHMSNVELDFHCSFIPDGADTAPFLCCPYDDGVAIYGIDPDYLFGVEFPMNAFVTPYGSAYDSNTHTLTIPDTINGLPVRAFLAPHDPALMNQNVYFDWDNAPQTITSSDFLQQRFAFWYNQYPQIDTLVETLILPHTIRLIGDSVFGDTLRTVHVPHAAQSGAYVFSQCPDTLTVCCDLPNSTVQQTVTAENAQRNFTFAVCTSHSTHTHTFGSWTVTTPATPTTTGVETRICTDCGAAETRTTAVIPAGYGFFSGGYGTADSPFLISTPADFDHIDDFYAAYGDDPPCDPIYFTQTADIAFYCNSYDETDENPDTDGSQGYAYCNYDGLWSGWVRPTPVSVMHNAVYDGGGYTIRTDCLIKDDDYAGLFGLVTDSEIRNLLMYVGYNGIITTAENGTVGCIARAENCTLDRVIAWLGNDVYPWGALGVENNTCGYLAGNAVNCRVENCIAKEDFLGGCDGLIGSFDAACSFRNNWEMHLWLDYDNYDISASPAAGIIDDHTDCWHEPLTMDSDGNILVPNTDWLRVVVDAAGNLQGETFSCDPNRTGQIFTMLLAESVTITASAHGSVIGAGQTILHGDFMETKTISALTPVADMGYVFTGWEIDVGGDSSVIDAGGGSYRGRSITSETDGSYTYSTVISSSVEPVTVTANFAPHESHSFDCVQTPATCTEDRQNVYTCSVCGYTYTETITAPGHSFGEWEITTPATVDAAGEETRECSVCGATETRLIDPLTPQGTIRVSPGRTHPGGIARITVSVEDNPGLAAMLLRIQYDSQILTLIDVENGIVFPDDIFVSGGDLNDSPFTVIWNDALATDANTADGALVTFTFAVDEDAPTGSTPITVTYDPDSTFDPDLHNVSFAVDNQLIAIGERMAGDSDGDGILSIRDVAAIERFLAGGWNVHVDLSNADVDGDGKLTLKDAVRIRRFLAGWDVTLQ